MTLLILAVAAVLLISALCSLTEAALYAVGPTYVRKLSENKSRAGKLLSVFKENMERPITAILIVNTVANTAGSAIAGGQAERIFGQSSQSVHVWFVSGMTLSVLIFSEIIPKVAGVAYNRAISRAMSIPLQFLINGLFPLVWLSQHLSSFIQRKERGPIAPEEEVQQMADLSAAEGSILPLEAALVRNVLALDNMKARDIMTPRTVVFKRPSNLTVKEVSVEADRLSYSRIPIHVPDDPDTWVGYVLKQDILACLARDEFDVTLASLAKKLDFFPDSTSAHILFNELIKRRRHLLGLVNEFGAMEGIITLEDVLETLIGQEIVDETDTIVDLQEAARIRGAEQLESGSQKRPETKTMGRAKKSNPPGKKPGEDSI